MYTEFAPPRHDKNDIIKKIREGRGCESSVVELSENATYSAIEEFQKLFGNRGIPDYYQHATLTDLLTTLEDDDPESERVQIWYNHSFILIDYNGFKKNIYPVKLDKIDTSAGCIKFVCPLSLLREELSAELCANSVSSVSKTAE